MKKVLVVDDDPGVRAYLKAVLNNSGFEASEASNGLDAIQIQKEMLCDLIIADIFMPAADGLSTIQNFRKLYPDLKMIAMSGGGVFGTKDYLGYALLFGFILEFCWILQVTVDYIPFCGMHYSLEQW